MRVFASIALAGAMALGSPAPPKAGDRAPAFSLRDLSGRTVALAAQRGKVVLIDFWATWCVPCREEIPHFIALQDKYAARGLLVIGISMDDSEAPVRTFAEKYHMNYPVVMGDARLGDRFGGILGLPVAFLVDRDGRIARRFDGQTDAARFESAVVALLGSGSGGRR